METKETVKTIEEMADTMERSANELRRVADSMGKTGDLNYSAEAINIVSNCILNLRLDLLITRPIRSYERKLTSVKG